ncbi:4Fe-4S binding protein [Candidatus Micrarchaeota archaeon]|nr:4Fe-4S binding protein [Candidatus Micrarchaeota archaeon]
MSIITEALGNLFKKPFTDDYPNVKKNMKTRFRGRILYDSKKCIGCRRCFVNCPVHAITFHKKGKIDFYMGKCVYCGFCRDVCPVKCIHYTHEFEYADSDKKRLRANLVE